MPWCLFLELILLIKYMQNLAFRGHVVDYRMTWGVFLPFYFLAHLLALLGSGRTHASTWEGINLKCCSGRPMTSPSNADRPCEAWPKPRAKAGLGQNSSAIYHFRIIKISLFVSLIEWRCAYMYNRGTRVEVSVRRLCGTYCVIHSVYICTCAVRSKLYIYWVMLCTVRSVHVSLPMLTGKCIKYTSNTLYYL